MSMWINVARYQLMDRMILVAQPWIILTLAFAVNLVVFANTPATPGHANYAGALASLYLALAVAGALTIHRRLPFALALGVSRRSYYLGSALLAIVLAAVYGLALTALQLVERGTDGWHLDLYFFRVPYLLAGSWYLTWLTSFIGLALMFAWGMWFGILYRRWNMIGLLSFAAAQVAALIAALLIINWAHGWHSVAHFFTTLTIGGVNGLFAALAVGLLIGGYATIRRATV